jgi:hypothetical protein
MDGRRKRCSGSAGISGPIGQCDIETLQRFWNNSRLTVQTSAVVVLAAVLAAIVDGCGLRSESEAGFSYDTFPFTLDAPTTAVLGGPLCEPEVDAIKRRSRLELEAAFSGLPLLITERANAFWSVRVRAGLEAGRSGPLPAAGETRALGRFGGHGDISFEVLATAAVSHAPPGASRQMIIEGIGRGIGRTAAHELAHAILGPSVLMDNRTDDQSYEYLSFDRSAQYYGELHWARAWPALRQKVGR